MGNGQKWACVAIVHFVDNGPPERIVVCTGSERRCVRASEIVGGGTFEAVRDGEVVEVSTAKNIYTGDRVPAVMTLAVCAPGTYEDEVASVPA